MRFVVDAQLPPALARWLASQGVEAEHVFDVGLAEAPDAVIWQQAMERVAVVVSKDEDFALRVQMSGGTCGYLGPLRQRPQSRVDSAIHGRMAWRRGCA